MKGRDFWDFSVGSIAPDGDQTLQMPNGKYYDPNKLGTYFINKYDDLTFFEHRAWEDVEFYEKAECLALGIVVKEEDEKINPGNQ